jgi:hypothetical protein
MVDRAKGIGVQLQETLPQALAETLGALNGGGEIVVAAATDLTLQGTFGEEWLVVTKDRLFVYPINGARPAPRLELPLAELRSPATDYVVGVCEVV